MSNLDFNKKDSARAESIRRQYMERGVRKMDQLQQLHDKVKAPGIAVAAVLGAFGALIMGAGMANVMVWQNMPVGLGLGIPGLVMALLAYPIYKGITGRRKKKYAGQIIALSNEIINSKDENA